MSASVPGAVGGLYDVGEDLDARLPDCPPEQAWARRRDEYRLVNPANRRRLMTGVTVPLWLQTPQ